MLIFQDVDFTRMPEQLQSFWREFASWLYDPSFLIDILATFDTVVKPRLQRAERWMGSPPEIRSDALLVSDHTNDLVLFAKTDRSFHGVEPITDPNPTRRLLINNIRRMNADVPA
jgi:hypothetical protein